MSTKRKLYEKIKTGSKKVQFKDFVTLIEAFGFRLDRQKGSHQIFLHPLVNRALNIQNRKGQAKTVQVKEFLEIVDQYNLELED